VRIARRFCSPTKLGFVEGYVGEHATDPRRKYHLERRCLLPASSTPRKNIKLGTGTINMPNTHPVDDRFADRHA
jgi:hypothetical protein